MDSEVQEFLGPSPDPVQLWYADQIQDLATKRSISFGEAKQIIRQRQTREKSRQFWMPLLAIGKPWLLLFGLALLLVLLIAFLEWLTQ